MRRAAVRAFRTTSQHTVRGLLQQRTTRRSAALFLQSASHHNPHNHQHYQALNSQRVRCLSSTSFALAPQHRLYRKSTTSSSLPLPPTASGEPLHSSMHIRRLSVAVVSGLVGYGAYYAYQGQGAGQSSPFSTKAAAAAAGAITSTTGASLAGAGGGFSATTGSEAAQTTRNVLVIGANELSTGTLVGDGPISKMTDGSGRRVLEMLAPDQVTQRLRKNEESYGINRGKGVLRYDLVQLASNDPIEDDHAEKIVEVPTKSAVGSVVSSDSSDWMFWGVFDGHSYVYSYLAEIF